MSEYQFNPSVEQWKEINEFPGYEISDHGNVRSYWKRVSNGVGKGCHIILVDTPQRYFGQYFGSSGYAQIRLAKDRKGYTKRIHQLILEAFNGPCPNGMEACHNDGDKSRNQFDNLRYDTRRNNLLDMNQHGTAPIGERHGRSKLTEKDVIEIRTLRKNNVHVQIIADLFNVSRKTISNIVNLSNWKHI